MSDESSPEPSAKSAASPGSPPPPPLVSPDGNFWWDGVQWQPFAPNQALNSPQHGSHTGQTAPAQDADVTGARVIPPPFQVATAEPVSGGSGFRWSWLIRAAIPLAVLAWYVIPYVADSMAEVDLESASGSMDEITCDELAEDAVRISAEDTGLSVKLLKIHDPTLVEDHRDDYEAPTGSDRQPVMACRGGGSWADGDTVDVRVELSVDADGESWVFFEPMY